MPVLYCWLQNIVQQTLSSMGDLGRNARVSVNSMVRS